MDTTAELGRDPASKHQIRPEYGDEQADAERDCRTNADREIFIFPSSADHEQDWQPYPVDPYCSCYVCDHTHLCIFK